MFPMPDHSTPVIEDLEISKMTDCLDKMIAAVADTLAGGNAKIVTGRIAGKGSLPNACCELMRLAAS